MSLKVSLHSSLRFFDMDVSFKCPDKKLFAMIGPSGGGKTSIIRMIAGLDMPDRGRITYNDTVWFDSDKGVNVMPQKRRLGYVFQDYLLFPHLSLYDNAAFAAVNRKDVDELFDLFGISHLKDRRPDMVSGGERQRCAICQAIARQPQFLLLDEPFSAIDAITRGILREELKNIKHRFTFPVIYVTHDINEALYLADELLPVVQGRIDPNWLKNTASTGTEDARGSRGARSRRLALVY